jgi:hypothetical protein
MDIRRLRRRELLLRRAASNLKRVQIKAECNQLLNLKWRQPLECGDKSPHSKDSVNFRTAIILHIVDAIEV